MPESSSDEKHWTPESTRNDDAAFQKTAETSRLYYAITNRLSVQDHTRIYIKSQPTHKVCLLFVYLAWDNREILRIVLVIVNRITVLFLFVHVKFNLQSRVFQTYVYKDNNICSVNASNQKF